MISHRELLAGLTALHACPQALPRQFTSSSGLKDNSKSATAKASENVGSVRFVEI